MADTFRNELLNGVRNAFCTALEIQENYYGYIAENNRWAIGAQLGEQFFDMAYRLACNREPPPPLGPPFTGGQCTHLRYNVTVYKNAVTSTGAPKPGYPTTTVVLVYGAITGTTVTVTAGVETVFVTSTTANVYAGNLNTPGEHFTEHYIVSAIPQGGVPDTCGNPLIPDPVPEPGYNNQPITINYTNNEGDSVNVPLNFIFAPVSLNLHGELTVPVRLDLGGVNLEISGDFNLSTGGLNLNFGNPNYSRNGLPNPDGYKPDPSLPDVPDDVPDDVSIPSSDNSQDETTRILRACIVTTDIVPPNISLIYQGGNPTITVPNLGYVSFAISVGGGLAWTSDIPVKNQRNFIVCPWEGGAVDVRGTPAVGVDWTITPVYANVEDAIEFA